MNPPRFLTRTAMLDEADRLAPTRGCRRAIREDRVAVLGGFKTIPPYGQPGWILRVLTRHGRTWLLAILVDEVKHVYTGRFVDEVPWAEWIGRTGQKGWNAYDGDKPEESHRERAKRALIHRFARLRRSDRDESVEGDQGCGEN